MNLSIKAQRYLEQGRELLDQDQPNQALEKFNQVLEIVPKHGCAYHLMGKALQRLGDQSAAESCQSLSCELDPSIGWNWYALGEYQQRRGELRDGIQSLMEASKWLPAERWLIDRAKRLKKQLIWNNVKSQKDAKPRFSLEALINGIWCIRPDIRIKLQGERERLSLWLLLEGVKEYVAVIVFRDELLKSLKPWAEQLAPLEPINPWQVQTEPVPLSRLMMEIWIQQKSLQNRFDINTLAGRSGLFWWFILEGTVLFGLEKLWTESLRDYINQPFDHSNPKITYLMHAAQRLLGDMDVIDLDLESWWKQQGLAKLGLEFEFVLEAKNNEYEQISDTSLLTNASPAAPLMPFGVNLIGFSRGQLGIGEDIRMAAKALEAAAIPCSVYEVQADLLIDSNENSLDLQLTESMPYQFNMFCLTGIETLRISVEDYFPMLLQRYINIGYWPWEFERWPLIFQDNYQIVDEIWASTKFTAEAYKADARVNVELMPMHVDVSQGAGLSRKAFDLPTDPFLFLFTFDVGSSLQRKNPIAILKAFQRAFPKDDFSVALVVKLMRGGSSLAPALLELRSAARADNRIIVIEETFPRAQLLDLIRVCDSYVSLHRCEGFGRGMAEAMLLGKTVIATKYSGNLDFCTSKTSLLVDAELIPVMPDEYDHAVGQYWANPSFSSAVEALQQAVTGWKPDLASIKEIERRYSAKVVSDNYRKRLEALRQMRISKSIRSY